MYAHVNIWQLTPAGASSDSTAAREIAARLRMQPGFHSYTLIRTGPQEVVAVTVFDSQEQLVSAMHKVTSVVREQIDPLAHGEPERRRGEVLYHAQE
jgi:hypothetical protein